MTIRVLIADDQQLMRGALSMCFAAEPDLDVVGEAADGLEAVELASRLRPDVAVVDVRMPKLDGVGAIRELTKLDGVRPIRAIAITTFDLDEYILDALQAGASGYLLKDANPEDIVRAVREVAAGNAVLAPAVTRRLLDRYARRLLPSAPPEQDKVARLTPRELHVLRLIARGMSNAELGRCLHLAESSIKTHVGRLLAKLGLPDRVHLVVFAYENGLISPGDPTDATDYP